MRGDSHACTEQLATGDAKRVAKASAKAAVAALTGAPAKTLSAASTVEAALEEAHTAKWVVPVLDVLEYHTSVLVISELDTIIFVVRTDMKALQVRLTMADGGCALTTAVFDGVVAKVRAATDVYGCKQAVNDEEPTTRREGMRTRIRLQEKNHDGSHYRFP